MQVASTKANVRKTTIQHSNIAQSEPLSGNILDPTLRELGTRLKFLRAERRLTLEELSKLSSVSRSMISKIERVEKSPTLSILVGLANGLGVNLSDLLGSKTNESEVSIIRVAERVVFKDQMNGFIREMLSPPHMSNGVEVLIHRIPPGQSSGLLPNYSVATEKYVMVYEGELTVQLDAKTFFVGKGDTMHFEVKSPYVFENRGDVTVSYYLVLVRSR